jgi:hypothetical protein
MGAWFSKKLEHHDILIGDSPESTLVTCKIGYMTTREGCKKIERGKQVGIVTDGYSGPAAVCIPGDMYTDDRGVVRFEEIKDDLCSPVSDTTIAPIVPEAVTGAATTAWDTISTLEGQDTIYELWDTWWNFNTPPPRAPAPASVSGMGSVSASASAPAEVTAPTVNPHANNHGMN